MINPSLKICLDIPFVDFLFHYPYYATKSLPRISLFWLWLPQLFDCDKIVAYHKKVKELRQSQGG